ncbi:nucleotidyltransferase domain-containing protein [Desulfuromonas acetexigens]|jgi:predicted nucleotidyltransferase|uniref:Nucleotidyltransferase domain-containing protein n=1 Tax=Trichloromonas acetexigens TaxID=38815 RepID=A0A550JF30_9BACT|nr:nucleotidyltransferase domain-containing protein [Desulfuromonas acetexigens]TRO81811.1 nucleotidyltransferase domain-containing protein [Desulfuromonas acetexigens]
MTVEKVLPEIVKRLVAAAQPEEIILFGSLARGEGRPDSDIDLLVIETEPFGPERSRLVEIGRLEAALGRLPHATDLLIYSRDEIKKWKDSPHHVIGRALREGTVLYARH